MKIFEFKIRWNQSIREFIAQDESRYIGEQRVETDSVRIVAPDEDLAVLYLKRAMANSKLEILNVISYRINIMVTGRGETIDMINKDRIIKE